MLEQAVRKIVDECKSFFLLLIMGLEVFSNQKTELVIEGDLLTH